jgi:thymidylate synthase
MNNIEQQYLDLVKDILENGYTKGDRTGTGTKSVFGRTIRHRMSDGFPLLTTKKMAFKTMVTELLWFLRGDTNIKYLVDNGCHIWDGDAYKNYRAKSNDIDLPENLFNKMIDDSNEKSMFPIDNPNKMLSQEEFINKIKTDDEFAKKWGELGPVYGAQWRRWTKFEDESIEHNEWYKSHEPIDQIANAIHLLKTDPDSRRILVNAWNVGELDQMVLPPCHYSFQFYTRELSLSERYEIMKNGDLNEWLTIHYKEPKTTEYMDKHNIPKRAISILWNQRSVDVGLGLPFNIASYALLLEIIAKQVNMIPEEVIGNLGDCHIYLNHIDGLKEQLTRTPYELPKLNINTEFWPTESGECGVGLIDAKAVLDSFSNDSFCKCLLEEDIQLYNYQYHPSIKLPLSN